MKVHEITMEKDLIFFIIVGFDDGGLVCDVVDDAEEEFVDRSRIEVVRNVIAVHVVEVL